MRHTAARRLLPDYALGLLPAGEARELQQHIAGCTACAVESDALAVGVSALAAVSALQPSLLQIATLDARSTADAVARIGQRVRDALEIQSQPAATPEPAAAPTREPAPSWQETSSSWQTPGESTAAPPVSPEEEQIARKLEDLDRDPLAAQDASDGHDGWPSTPPAPADAPAETSSDLESAPAAVESLDSSDPEDRVREKVDRALDLLEGTPSAQPAEAPSPDEPAASSASLEESPDELQTSAPPDEHPDGAISRAFDQTLFPDDEATDAQVDRLLEEAWPSLSSTRATASPEAPAEHHAVELRAEPLPLSDQETGPAEPVADQQRSVALGSGSAAVDPEWQDALATIRMASPEAHPAEAGPAEERWRPPWLRRERRERPPAEEPPDIWAAIASGVPSPEIEEPARAGRALAIAAPSPRTGRERAAPMLPAPVTGDDAEETRRRRFRWLARGKQPDFDDAEPPPDEWARVAAMPPRLAPPGGQPTAAPLSAEPAPPRPGIASAYIPDGPTAGTETVRDVPRPETPSSARERPHTGWEQATAHQQGEPDAASLPPDFRFASPDLGGGNGRDSGAPPASHTPPRRRRIWPGRDRPGRRRPGAHEDRDGSDSEMPTLPALAPTPRQAPPRRGPLGRLVGDEDEDAPEPLVSIDDEIRRMSLPALAAPAGATPPPMRLVGPIEWGLERYDDDDEEEALVLAGEGLVSSTWRFWTILLGVFSAILFGIVVVGYFYLRDLNKETQQLTVEQQTAAQYVRFRAVTTFEDFNTRGEGYLDSGGANALFSFGGLPPIEREQRYALWATNATGTTLIGTASPLGGSSQYITARRVPDDIQRIFLTIESRVGETWPEQPQGTVLLEVDVP